MNISRHQVSVSSSSCDGSADFAGREMTIGDTQGTVHLIGLW